MTSGFQCCPQWRQAEQWAWGCLKVSYWGLLSRRGLWYPHGRGEESHRVQGPSGTVQRERGEWPQGSRESSARRSERLCGWELERGRRRQRAEEMGAGLSCAFSLAAKCSRGLQLPGERAEVCLQGAGMATVVSESGPQCALRTRGCDCVCKGHCKG